MSGWGAILAAAQAPRQAFERTRATPRTAQWQLLRRILATNADTEFGRAHGFDQITSLEAFRSRVPIRSYQEFQPWIDRVAAGEPAILTKEPVVAFEETGGSTGGRKLIPYTASGLAAFRAAVLPWLASLAERRPGIAGGKVYVTVSPALRPARCINGIPLGLPSEGAYLGADLVGPFASLLAVAPEVSNLADIDEWRLATLASLLATADLTFISVWSPTFLTGLIDAMSGLREPLLRALRDGTRALATASPRLPPRGGDAVRARVVEQAFASEPIDTRRIWQRFDTISAWADGSSKHYARRLQEMFPHAYFEPKGLLATESAVTLPYGFSSPIPALMSAVLEFVDEAGSCCTSDELRKDATYRVVITTASGLFRYDLGDRLYCLGHADRTPLLEFVGRAGVCSDLVGEKLSEDFVSAVLTQLDGPACLAPRAAARPFYELLVEARADATPASMAARIELRLCANPQYAYARAMGQLGPLQSRAVDHLLERHARAEARRGRRLADVKPPVLIDAPDTYAALTNRANDGIAVTPTGLPGPEAAAYAAAARAI